MRLLADAGISPATVAFLEQLGHDVVHVRALNMQRASDRAIVGHATTDNRSVLTFDLDFGDVLALGVLDRPSVVLLRVSNERPEENRRLSVAACRSSLASSRRPSNRAPCFLLRTRVTAFASCRFRRVRRPLQRDEQ
jgi:predicted nuclease of predicted toxin-antitoxin system